VTDLSQPLVDEHGLALGPGGHVAIDQRVGKITWRGRELAEQVSREPAFRCFNDGTRMMSHQPRHQRAGALNIAKMAGTIKRMETAAMQRRRVTNVVQPRRRSHGVSVATKDRDERPRYRRDPLRMSPPVRQGFFEETAGECLSPGCVDHETDVSRAQPDVHGRRQAISGRLADRPGLSGSAARPRTRASMRAGLWSH
jgi:hypothetical protein